MSWAWEYDPSMEYVAAGAPSALLKEVEKLADELVRAASAFYLDGTGYQGDGPKGQDALLPGGMFVYLIVPRHERLYIRQITAW
ncbi:hypothetical protein OG455_26810 [Kitasatospora sp. NBC_01287]|uniref:hypothetical protein n=1 Tax=Kitasatospora sp. NBC_01287 TaxID=2903573 RepID=UPI00225263D1|nr:hypothetical protein [Kitasatospora sp. NBC_01287]MCX4749076.1 hypothetical protein [Kitasatospora sp. NBC_01287]